MAVEVPNQLIACVVVVPGTPNQWSGPGVAEVKRNALGDWEVTCVDEVPSGVTVGTDKFGVGYTVFSPMKAGDHTGGAEAHATDKRKIIVKTFTAGAAADFDFSLEVRSFGVPYKAQNAT